MKLHAPFVQLPISFDAQRLAAEVLALDATKWRPHPQGFPGNSMLPLVAVDGEPTNENFAGRMRPTPELQACPYLHQALASFGATVGRTRLMRLSGGAEVTRHADQFYYWTERVRIHVPLITQPGVRFECGDAALHMAAGECWIFDTWRQHRVVNDDPRERIHLVCDSVGGDVFWDLVQQGRAIDGTPPPPDWQAKRVAYSASPPPAIAYESFNVPVVMSPWELQWHVDFLVGELPPSPRQEAMRTHAARLCRAWRGLWAERGDAREAIPAYKALMARFLAEAQPLIGDQVLRNDLAAFPAFMAGVGRIAASGPPALPALDGLPARPPTDQPYRH